MKFEMNKAGCIKARKWLRDHDLLSKCGPSDCDGITFIVCANELYAQRETSPYYMFADIKCHLTDLKLILESGEDLTLGDVNTLENNIEEMVSGFTKLIIGEIDD